MLKRLMVATFYLTSGKDALLSLLLTCTRNSVGQTVLPVVSIWQVWVANNKGISIERNCWAVSAGDTNSLLFINQKLIKVTCLL